MSNQSTARSHHSNSNVWSSFFSLAFLLFAFNIAIAPASASTPKSTTWTSRAPMPSASADLTAAAYNGNLYTFGGYRNGANDVLNTTSVYYPLTDTWQIKAPMPTARWGEIAVEVEGQIYVFGGASNCAEIGTAVNEVYSPKTDTWSTRLPIPADLGQQGLMAVKYGNKVHLFYQSSHYEYDPATDSYTPKAAVPTPRTWGTVAVIGNTIYVIGGYSWNTNQATNVNEAYDPATDTWSTKASSPISRYGTPRENPVINNQVYITHGYDSTTFYATGYAYNPASNSWLSLATASQPRDGVASAVIRNKLYVVGGRADTGACATGPHGVIFNERYDSGSHIAPPLSSLLIGLAGH